MDDVAEIPLPWERLLWSGRPFSARARARDVRYFLTDFRVLSRGAGRIDEILLQDIADVHLVQSRLGRALGFATLRIESRLPGAPELELTAVRRGPQLAALLELLAGQSQAGLDARGVQAALDWEPRTRPRGAGEALAAFVVFLVAIAAVVTSVGGQAAAIGYAADDPIYPNGEKRSREDITRFMESEVMPWARSALGPLKGGADRISCETCHGRNPEARGWAMPAVAALPNPGLRDEGWERYSANMDAQMRNAIYGYLAEPEKQQRMGYMREIVMPGMAQLLHRPPYDFTKTYAFNRSHLAFGCYHCHRISP